MTDPEKLRKLADFMHVYLRELPQAMDASEAIDDLRRIADKLDGLDQSGSGYEIAYVVNPLRVCPDSVQRTTTPVE